MIARAFSPWVLLLWLTRGFAPGWDSLGRWPVVVGVLGCKRQTLTPTCGGSTGSQGHAIPYAR